MQIEQELIKSQSQEIPKTSFWARIWPFLGQDIFSSEKGNLVQKKSEKTDGQIERGVGPKLS